MGKQKGKGKRGKFSGKNGRIMEGMGEDEVSMIRDKNTRRL